MELLHKTTIGYKEETACTILKDAGIQEEN